MSWDYIVANAVELSILAVFIWLLWIWMTRI